jgi:hypothetical protein
MKTSLLTIPVVAQELGIAYETAYKWIATKAVVPSELLGTIRVVRREDFEVFAEAYRRGDYERWSR